MWCGYFAKQAAEYLQKLDARLERQEKLLVSLMHPLIWLFIWTPGTK